MKRLKLFGKEKTRRVEACTRDRGGLEGGWLRKVVSNKYVLVSCVQVTCMLCICIFFEILNK